MLDDLANEIPSAGVSALQRGTWSDPRAWTVTLSENDQLHYLGREYPDPNYDFHGKMRRLFERNRTLTEEAEIVKALALAEHIKNETLALYSLKKYRHLRRAYEPPS